MQVAQQNMPLSSLVIGVDLVPIKSVHKNCLSIQTDITTDHCRRELDAVTQSQSVDVVLHDGAPNVGQNWLHDAFSQAQLVLHALRLATKLLRKGGVFVTKIFRSKDHPALVVVFNQLFNKVNVTKPQASRNESAEIFAVCVGYKKPAAIDPALLDPKSVFRDLSIGSEAPKLNVLQPEKRRKKTAEGYADGDLTVYHALPASTFLDSDNFVELLGQANQITLDSPETADSPLSTSELRECLKDIQVLGRRELKLVLSWRKVLLQKREAAAKAARGETEDGEKGETEEMPEPTEEERLEEEIASRRLEETQAAKRVKRKAAKERSKRRQQEELGMVLPGDPGPTDGSGEPELFNLARLARQKAAAEAGQLPKNAEEEEDLEWEGEEGGERELPESEQMLVTEEGEVVDKAKRAKHRTELWFSRAAAALPGQEAKEEEEEEDDEEFDRLLARLKERKAKAEAKKAAAAEPEEEEDEAMEESQAAVGTGAGAEEEEEGSSSDSEVADDGSARKTAVLDSEGLALGAEMVRSSKSRRDIEDAGWNRYAHNDDNLPAWFAADEKRHQRKPLPVSRAAVAEYEERRKGAGVAGIKKVVEAKARKRKRLLRGLEKAKKKANNVVENPVLSSSEKSAELRRLSKAVARGRKKEEVAYVVAKKGQTGGRKVRRPPGVKGKFRVVDTRMKKDVRAAANAERKKTGKGGKHGGKNWKAKFGHKKR